ncbi:zinc/cadmium resistance protein isoform X2 [Alosa alosa]|nr:zinc/cadmium resistance protein isoform X2 [Alosa alosa]
MDGHVRLWRGIGYKCMLGLTLLLLLFEIVVSRLCNCLINMVDGFHTLYILLHLSLQQPLSAHTPPPSPPPLASLASPSLTPSPHIISSNSHITSCPHPSSSPPSSPRPDLNIVSSAGPIPTLGCDPTSALSCVMPSRVQPFGALVSALIVASLCVSVTLEILSYIFQPHPIQRPILATAASALSLLFNAAMLGLAWARPTLRPAGSASEHLGLGSGERAVAKATEDGLVKGALQDGSLLFCNPGAPSVLDPDSDSVTPTTTDSLGSNKQHERSSSSEPKEHLQSNSRALELTNVLSQVPMYSTGHTGYPASLCVPSLSVPYKAPLRGHQSSCLSRVLTTILRDLLCPCLALANALTALLSSPDCHHPLESCSSRVYLDPALSMMAVLVLLACALPEVRRLGLLLLQSCPPGLSVPDLRNGLMAVRGVEGVHELHVWQLTESCLVASVHVHMNAHCWREGPDKVVAGVMETLHRAGVSMCTVQPETATESLNGEPALPALPGNQAKDWPCSLSCRKECLDKMCCTSLKKASVGDGAPPSGNAEEKAPQAVIIENTFL